MSETETKLPVTAEMIREMEGHTPFDLLDDPPKRWQWRADYLNASIQNPGAVCACCNVARDGDVMDHLPPLNEKSPCAGATDNDHE